MSAFIYILEVKNHHHFEIKKMILDRWSKKICELEGLIKMDFKNEQYFIILEICIMALKCYVSITDDMSIKKFWQLYMKDDAKVDYNSFIKFIKNVREFAYKNAQSNGASKYQHLDFMLKKCLEFPEIRLLMVSMLEHHENTKAGLQDIYKNLIMRMADAHLIDLKNSHLEKSEIEKQNFKILYKEEISERHGYRKPTTPCQTIRQEGLFLDKNGRRRIDKMENSKDKKFINVESGRFYNY